MYSSLYRTLRLIQPRELEIRRHLRELEQMQSWSRAELEAWQLAKLRQLVQHASLHVPYYRELFKREGIYYEDIKSLKDFQALPVLSKEDVNTNLSALVADNHPKIYAGNTGGSTGHPMRFFVEEALWRWNAAHEFQGRLWYGVHRGDKMAWVWGAPQDLPHGGWKKSLIAGIKRWRYLSAFSLSRHAMQSFAEMLVRWKPEMFRAYPSALALFAQHLKEGGIRDIRPKLIETCAEKLTAPQRQLFEEVFGCPVAECYASRELSTIAYQCPAGRLHISATRHIEVVANGISARPGEMGEMIITSLNQFAMPFIRYRIDDLGVYESDACRCGRTSSTLREIVGRANDFLVNDEGTFVHGQLFANLLLVKPEVVKFQVSQPDTRHLEVRLVCRTDVDDAWRERVRSAVQARFGPTTQVSLEVVNDIPLTPAGKHRFIISNVKPTFPQTPSTD